MSNQKVKIVGVIDEDPFDQRTWSGSSHYFFNALRQKNSLLDAIDAYPSKLLCNWYKLKSFQTDLKAWKFKYHLNTDLFAAMSNIAKKKIEILDREQFNTVLQVGAWYDLTNLNQLTASYHDGNLATRLASPFGYPNVSKSVTNKTLEHERRLYSRIDLIFPMSRWLANSFIRDFGCAEDKVIPVGAGINLPKVRPVKRDQMHFNLLTVGKDFERKGGKYLLEAFTIARRQLPQLSLTIIGPTLTSLPDGVHCLGFLDKRTPEGLEKLLDAYENSSAFILPSLYEPFGIAFAEAMAHRLPCIGTRNCAMPEIIKENETGLLAPIANSKGLAEKILDLFADEGQYLRMCNAAYEHYRENYTWEVVTGKIITAIENHL